MTTRQLSEQEQAQKAYYNRIAEKYDEHYAGGAALDYRNKLYSKSLAGIKLEGISVLDAACGGGENTGFFLSQGANVAGLDISEQQCEHFAKRFPETEIHCASIRDMPFEDERFDLIVTESLHHFHPFMDDAIKEIGRVLKPGGTFVFWEPNARSLIDRARRLWYKTDKSYFEDNEASIDLPRLVRDQEGVFTMKRAIYGGNIGYLLVHNSMHFRMSPGVVKVYAGALNGFEKLITPLIGSWNSCWVLGVLEKTSDRN